MVRVINSQLSMNMSQHAVFFIQQPVCANACVDIFHCFNYTTQKDNSIAKNTTASLGRHRNAGDRSWWGPTEPGNIVELQTQKNKSAARMAYFSNRK